ncbi:unnamed protein product, partial [Rotaria sp. Silwood2]
PPPPPPPPPPLVTSSLSTSHDIVDLTEEDDHTNKVSIEKMTYIKPEQNSISTSSSSATTDRIRMFLLIINFQINISNLVEPTNRPIR